MNKDPIQTPQTTPKSENLNEYREIVEFANKEIIRVHFAYKLLLVSVTILIGIGIFFTVKSSSDFKTEIKSDMQSSIAAMKKDLESQILTYKDALKEELNKHVDELKKQVNIKIEEEFKKDNIYHLVQDVAEKRIDETADQIIEKKIEEKIKPKIAEVNDSAKKIQENLDVIFTVTKAYNNDRQAFDKLANWGDNPNSPFVNVARDAETKIRASYLGLQVPYDMFPWGKDDKPEQLSLLELENIYQKSPIQYHPSLLITILGRTDITKKEKMSFLVNVLKTDENLTALFYAGKRFSEEAKIEWKPFVTEPLLEWWEQNKDKIK